MDVSFSANTWKHFQIQNIDLKLEEEFYASTPYNLNDFKQTSKPPCPIFKTIDSNSSNQKNIVKKELQKKQNISLAIFITYLHQFLHQVIGQIQKKSQHVQGQGKKKTSSQPHLKLQKESTEPETDKQTDRRLIMSPQKNEKKPNNEEFEVLKSLKLKIYEIDLCRLKNAPQKLNKYYNNNLLKKIIFQYLSKALYNVSLVEILLESNEVLCFALSLVSQSLLCKKEKITKFNENRSFYDEAFTFLSHFDSLEDPCLAPSIKSTSNLPSTLSTHSKYQSNKIKTSQELIKTENFMNFLLSQKQMKSKSFALREESFDSSKKYTFCLLNNKKNYTKKISSPSKSKQKPRKQSPKKYIPSTKTISIKSQRKLQQVHEQKGWMKYLGCLKYFFSDSKHS